MRKRMALLFLGSLLVGCFASEEIVTERPMIEKPLNETNLQENLKGNSEENITSSPSENETKKIDANKPKVEKEQIIENSKNNHSYPVLTEIINEEAVNQLIKNKALKLEEQYEDFDLVFLDLNYEIMFQNSEYLSILFKGEVKSQNETYPFPYPIEIKESLNIKLDQGQLIPLNQFLTIDDSFLNQVTSHLTEHFKEMGVELEDVMPLGVAHEIEKANDVNNADVQFYFTSEEFTLIFSVIHALGDFIEIQLPMHEVITTIN